MSNTAHDDRVHPVGYSNARLRELTDSNAVREAITEFLALGRDEFLRHYGFERSRDYFVDFDGQLIDSKPILSLAYFKQYPDRGLMPVANFSGGRDGAKARLSALGFTTVTPAQLRPPRLGATYPDRTAIWNAFGGDKQAGIVRFPGDDVVNLFSDDNGPYADDQPTLAEAFGYRGEGLAGPQSLSQRGNSMLEQARLTRSAVRFWHRPVGEDFSFLTWVIVLGRAWTSGTGIDGVERTELEWRIEAIPDPAAGLPPIVVDDLEEASQTVDDDPTAPEARPNATYSDLVERVERRGQHRREGGKPRIDYARSAAARHAVLLRSNGTCESPRCTGMPAELTRSGKPILDVDHIQDLGLGGADHPDNMAALCPNCHACKTRGANTSRWRKELIAIARRAHQRALET